MDSSSSSSPSRPPVPPRTGRAQLLQQPSKASSHYQQQGPQQQRPISGGSPTGGGAATSALNPPPLQQHIFGVVFFRQPQFCPHCADYIWGAGNDRGVHCSRCRQSFHRECAQFVNESATCSPTVSSSLVCTTPQVYHDDLPVDSWSEELILQWLAATNLSLYADQFRANLGGGGSGGGGCLLRQLDADTLLRWRIHNEDHRLAILLAIDLLYSETGTSLGAVTAGLKQQQQQQQQQQQLRGREGMSHQSLWTSPGPCGGGSRTSFTLYPSESHRLVLMTLAGKPRPCYKCGVVLWGHVRQGWKCLDCGRSFHRTCAAIGLPKCTGPSSGSSAGVVMDVDRPLSKGGAVHVGGGGFGAPLADLPTSYLTTCAKIGGASSSQTAHLPDDVPLVVFICASELERRGRKKNDDLFQIYDNPVANEKTEDVVAGFKRCHSLQSFQQVRWGTKHTRTHARAHTHEHTHTRTLTQTHALLLVHRNKRIHLKVKYMT